MWIFIFSLVKEGNKMNLLVNFIFIMFVMISIDVGNSYPTNKTSLQDSQTFVSNKTINISINYKGNIIIIFNNLII